MSAVVTDRSLFRRMGPLAVGVAVLLAGCGNADAAKAASAAKAGIGGERFVQIGFADIPHPDPVVIKEKKTKDLLHTEQYERVDVTADAVIDFYTGALATRGWKLDGKVVDTRAGKQGSWTKMGRTLVVLAKDGTPDPGKPSFAVVGLSFSRVQRPGG